MRSFWISLLLLTASLQGKEVDECFKGLGGKPFELLALFLPPDPVIANFYPYEEPLFQKKWPKALFTETSPHLLRIPQDRVLPFLKSHPEAEKTLKVLYIDLPLFPYPEGSFPYWELKYALEDKGFLLLSHWYKEGAEGSMLFVKDDYFYSQETSDYLKAHPMPSGQYGYYPLIVFPTYYGPVRYCLDSDDRDSVKRTLKSGYAYEGNLSRIMHALIRPGSVAIDIGAHIGAHTIFMSRKVGDLGAIIAFEPNKKLYMEHLYNLQINGCRNVLSLCKGLGDSQQRVSLRGIEIEQMEPVLEGDQQFIDLITLDSLKLNGVSLIKIDVENYEYFVLQGAKETLARNKPLIVFECWIGHAPEHRDQVAQKKNFERVISFLHSFGYDIYILYNCDFLAVPADDKNETTTYFKNKFEKLDLQTYMDESYREKRRENVVSPFD